MAANTPTPYNHLKGKYTSEGSFIYGSYIYLDAGNINENSWVWFLELGSNNYIIVQDLSSILEINNIEQYLYF